MAPATKHVCEQHGVVLGNALSVRNPCPYLRVCLTTGTTAPSAPAAPRAAAVSHRFCVAQATAHISSHSGISLEAGGGGRRRMQSASMTCRAYADLVRAAAGRRVARASAGLGWFGALLAQTHFLTATQQRNAGCSSRHVRTAK